MISQSFYQTLRESIDRAILLNPGKNLIEPVSSELPGFLHPYVLVIHRPTKHGFYLDRNYRHIIDICNCKEPKDFIEVTRDYLCASSSLPEWVSEKKAEDFDTFWLY